MLGESRCHSWLISRALFCPDFRSGCLRGRGAGACVSLCCRTGGRVGKGERPAAGPPLAILLCHDAGLVLLLLEMDCAPAGGEEQTCKHTLGRPRYQLEVGRVRVRAASGPRLPDADAPAQLDPSSRLCGAGWEQGR